MSDRLIVPGEFQAETAKLACDELLEREPGLTAVFCGNDKMAMGVYQSVRGSGREVGSDVAVMGCDDIPLAALAQPGLTTISLNFAEVGRRACDRMIDLIEAKGGGEGASSGGRIGERVPVHLVERASTGGDAEGVGRVVAGMAEGD
jgi:LacI family transcriptional regulator